LFAGSFVIFQTDFDRPIISLLNLTTMSIPVVDLADFLSGDPQRKAAFVQSLGKAYEEVGFVAVKNHGVPDELIANQYEFVHNVVIPVLAVNMPKAATRRT
jgi:hypothetical protein